MSDAPSGERVELARDLGEDARERFERHARAASALESEHVTRILEIGRTRDGVPFVVRERTLGDVAAEIASGGPVPVAEAVAWTLEVCEALAEAHTRRLAHGDVRPETVALARDARGCPIAKLTWPSAKAAHPASREDVAADVAAAGRLLRFLVSGSADLERDGGRTLPADLAHAVARATTVDRRAGFHNVGELAAAIAKYAPPGHAAARNVTSILARAGVVARISAAPAERPARAPSVPDAGRRSLPGLNDAWFEPKPIVIDDARRPAPRSRSFAVVATLLVVGTLATTLLLWTTGRLPRWSGTAPVAHSEPPAVSRATLTAADVRDTTSMTLPPALAADPATAEREERAPEPEPPPALSPLPDEP